MVSSLQVIEKMYFTELQIYYKQKIKFHHTNHLETIEQRNQTTHILTRTHFYVFV